MLAGTTARTAILRGASGNVHKPLEVVGTQRRRKRQEALGGLACAGPSNSHKRRLASYRDSDACAI
jgi:hypothetical protein